MKIVIKDKEYLLPLCNNFSNINKGESAILMQKPESEKAFIMIYYGNFYGVKKGTELYDLLVRTNLKSLLEDIYGCTDYENKDPKELTLTYLKSTGVSQEVIDRVKLNLGE